MPDKIIHALRFGTKAASEIIRDDQIAYGRQMAAAAGETLIPTPPPVQKYNPHQNRHRR